MLRKRIKRWLAVLAAALMILTSAAPAVVYGAEFNEVVESSYLHLTDLWNTDKLLLKQSGWNDARALKINENEPGNNLSLLIDGQKTYFLNGIFAHATSTLIFDISDYTEQDFDTFSAYVGVDTYASSNGNGVRFTISASTDNQTWVELQQTEVFKGNTNARKLTLPIAGYKYLKLYASDMGSNASDHAVYADALIYDSAKYRPRESTTVDWILSTDAYDVILANQDAATILSDQNLRLLLLQRTLVSRVGYSLIQAYASSSDENYEFLNWLFTAKDASGKYILEQYLEGGTPVGTYVNALNVFRNLRRQYGTDMQDVKDGDLYLRMMMAISLTHSSNVSFWVSGKNGERVLSNPIKRYEALKKLYTKTGLPNNYQPVFETQIFSELSVEELRWVVDNQLSDEEIPWLNWYSSRIQNPDATTKYDGRNASHTPKNPYTYIQYANGWDYYDLGYYAQNSEYCGQDYLNKAENGYARGLNCNDEYHLDEWGVNTHTPSMPRLWIVWEEDGVCGSLSKTGANLEAAYGNPTAVIGQPGHAAYLISTQVRNADGTYSTKWDLGNDVFGWAQSEKGERFFLDWGSKSVGNVSYYNVSYILLGQHALDDYDNFEQALLYNHLAKIYSTDYLKQREIYRTMLGIQNFNFDAWSGLVRTYLSDPTLESEDYYDLALEIMQNLKAYPLPMYDLLKLIEPKLNEDHKYEYSNLLDRQLKELSQLNNNDPNYLQAQAIRQVAQYLRDQIPDTAPTFSFDGEDANKIVLPINSPFEYSLDYSYDNVTGEVHATWTQVTSGNTADLSDRLKEINSTNDIVVHVLVDTDRRPTGASVTIIDILDGTAPGNLYANDLENQVIGWTNTMEWRKENDETWTKFTTAKPDLTGSTYVYVRNAAHDTTLPGADVRLTFEADPAADPTKVYIPISHLSAIASSQQNAAEAAEHAIDGNANTYWHNRWDGADKDRWIKIKIDEGPVELSMIDYMPRQDSGSNGRFLTTKLEVSLDGETWTTIDDNIVWSNDRATKTYVLQTPTLANYVRLTALKSAGDFASAAMINLYKNTVPHTIPVDDLTVSYMTSGFTYDGTEQRPTVVVRYQDQELILGEDYTLDFSNNIDAGEASFELTGLGIYDGKKTFTFTIAKAAQPSVLPDTDMSATISEKTLADLPLPDGWAWEIPSTNLPAGQTITAKAVYVAADRDNYDLTEIEITITKAQGNHPEISLKADAVLEYDITTDAPMTIDDFIAMLEISDVEDNAAGIQLDIQYDTDWNGSWDKRGTFYIVVTVTDSDGNVTEYTLTITLVEPEATPEQLDESFTVEIDPADFIYDGTAQTPTITVSKDGYILKEGIDYELVYSDNTNAGQATVTIVGIGSYTGSIAQNFTINKVPRPDRPPITEIAVSSDAASVKDIILPDGYVWADSDTELAVGQNTVRVIYLGDSNHDRYDFEITVIRETPPAVDEPEDDDPAQPDTPTKPSKPSTPSTPSDSTGTSGTTRPSAPSIVGQVPGQDTTTGDPTDADSSDESDQEEQGASDNDSRPSTSESQGRPAESATPAEGEEEFNWLPIILAIIAVTGGFIWFIIAKKRKSDDEEEK